MDSFSNFNFNLFTSWSSFSLLLAAFSTSIAFYLLLQRKKRRIASSSCCSCSRSSRSSSSSRRREEKDNEEMLNITLKELSCYDGKKDKKIFVSLRGKIYNVSSNDAGNNFYGPNGPYNMFAGKDATMALAKMSFDESLLNTTPEEWEGLDAEGLRCLDEWIERFNNKYPVVGFINYNKKEE